MRKLTIFTPTYNRAYILPQLYDSLVSQTNNKFEWLIVDDGSTDNTEEFVQKWMEENLIQIRYIKQKNGGKMKAHNTGVMETNTELFFCVDSDDYLADTAVNTILNVWDSISEEVKNKLSGMVGYKGSDPGKCIGNEFPKNVTYDSLSGFYEKGLTGDTSLIFRTEVIQQYLFPIIANEKFITEAYIYDQIDRSYQLCAIPQVLTICEYREDGLTRNLLNVTFQNPCGYVAYNLQRGNFAKTARACFLFYVRARAFSKYTKEVDMPIRPSRKFLYTISWPFGKLFFLYKQSMYKKNQ